MSTDEPHPDGHPFCTFEKKPKVVIVGKLSDAKAKGVAGVVGCSGCASTRGTLVGKNFQCETAGCRFQRKAAPRSPWTK